MTDTITESDKLHCAERELLYRQRVYRRLVDNGKMSSHAAAREIALMEAIVEDYRMTSEADRLL